MYRATLLVAAVVCLRASVDGAPVSIAGKVVNQAGQPVSGAEVRLVLQDPTELVRLQSDARGAFSWEWDGERELSGTLTVIAPGLSAASAFLDLTDPHPVLIRLAPEARLRGVVRDEEGRPVADARVVLSIFRPAGAKTDDFAALVWLYPDPPIQATTGADGRFDIGGVPGGATSQLSVRADGSAAWSGGMSEERPALIAGSAEEYEVQLQRGGFVEGTVTRGGQLVAGVKVFAGPVRGAAEGDEAVTDAAGRYRLAHLAEATFNIMLDEVEGLVAAAHENVAVVAGQTLKDIDFSLTPGGLIEGRVVDAETGAPVPKVRVASYGPSRPRSTGACISVLTDENGAYRMRVAPGNSYVYYQGGTPDYPFGQEASFEIDVAESQTVKAPELKVKRVEPIVVEVVGTDGKPVPNASVTYYTDWHIPTQADADGKCLIYGVRAGRPIIVTASDADGKLAGAAVVEGAQPQETVTVPLDRPASITLRLLDPQGEPLPGLTVQLALTAEAPRPEDLPPLEAYCHAVIAKAVSDEVGEVRFEGLPAGVTPEVFSTEKTASPPEWPEIPVLEPGATYGLGDVLLDLRKMRIRGTVVSADETPVAEAMVAANVWRGPRAHTDDQGGFVLEGFSPSEEVLVVAASPDRKLFGGEVVVPEWELEPAITLTPPVRIVGVLIGQDGRPVPRRALQVDTVVGGGADGFPTRGETKTDDNGAFAFEPVVPGAEYRLSAPDAKRQKWFLIHTFMVAPGADCALGQVKLPDFVKP